MAKSLTFLKIAVVSLAAMGIVLPPTHVLAGNQKSHSKPNVKVVNANSIPDVSLGQGGTFRGRVVDHAGTPLEGAKVIFTRGTTDVAHAMTDEHGTFITKNLNGGVYQVRSGNTVGIYRVWSEKGAPPSAHPQGLLVMGENGARGQWGVMGKYGEVILMGVAVLAIVALCIAIHADEEAENAVKKTKSP